MSRRVGRAGRSRRAPDLDAGTGPGTESAGYYETLATAFGFQIEITGPDFGAEPLLDVLAGSGEVATLVGDRTRLAWPAEHDLRRIGLAGPEPVYRHWLLWHRGNEHPALSALREYFRARWTGAGEVWAPAWAR